MCERCEQLLAGRHFPAVGPNTYDPEVILAGVRALRAASASSSVVREFDRIAERVAAHLLSQFPGFPPELASHLLIVIAHELQIIEWVGGIVSCAPSELLAHAAVRLADVPPEEGRRARAEQIDFALQSIESDPMRRRQHADHLAALGYTRGRA